MAEEPYFDQIFNQLLTLTKYFILIFVFNISIPYQIIYWFVLTIIG